MEFDFVSLPVLGSERERRRTRELRQIMSEYMKGHHRYVLLPVGMTYSFTTAEGVTLDPIDPEPDVIVENP